MFFYPIPPPYFFCRITSWTYSIRWRSNSLNFHPFPLHFQPLPLEKIGFPSAVLLHSMNWKGVKENGKFGVPKRRWVLSVRSSFQSLVFAVTKWPRIGRIQIASYKLKRWWRKLYCTSFKGFVSTMRSYTKKPNRDATRGKSHWTFCNWGSCVSVYFYTPTSTCVCVYFFFKSFKINLKWNCT